MAGDSIVKPSPTDEVVTVIVSIRSPARSRPESPHVEASQGSRRGAHAQREHAFAEDKTEQKAGGSVVVATRGHEDDGYVGPEGECDRGVRGERKRRVAEAQQLLRR